MKRMALPHISFHLSSPFLQIRSNSPFADSSMAKSSFPSAFRESVSERFSSMSTSVHSGCRWYCSLIYFAKAARIYAKMVSASWSEQSASSSNSWIPRSHRSCFPRKLSRSDLWEIRVIGRSKFSFISSLASDAAIIFLSLSSLLLKMILSLSTPSLKATFCTSSIFYFPNSTSGTFFISKRKYFSRASMPRSFLYPETMCPYSSILKSKRSTHSIRLNWSLTSILLRRVSHWSEMGLISLGMRRSLSLMTLMSCEMELDSKGQYPKSISNKTTPRDHMSALRVQISSLRISGAMQMGEPSMVCAMFISSILQKPKSPSFTFPYEKKMLSGLRSRCMMLFLLSSLKASSSWRKMTSASSSLSVFFFWRRDSSVPPLQYSQTKQKLLGVLRVSMNRTMLSFLSVERMLISLMASCSSLGLALKELFGMTFTAYSSLDFWCRARKTCPYTPFPIGSCSRQFYTSLLIQIQYMILRQALGPLDDADDSPLLDDVAFRQKDALLLREECARKYNAYTQALAQKLELQARLLKLREELNAISPDALEELDRECSQRVDSEENPQLKPKKSKINKNAGKSSKKNERRKRPAKLTYT